MFLFYQYQFSSLDSLVKLSVKSKIISNEIIANCRYIVAHLSLK